MKHILLGMAAISASLVCASPLTAAPVTPPKPAQNVETRITSDQLTYMAEKQLVVFDKNVHVVRPDIEIWADKITVYLKPPKDKEEGKAGGMPAGMAAGDVDKIVAERNVRMKSENRSGTCAKATYTMDNGVLLMEGDPRLTDGENTVTGETIRYYTEENRSEVLGGGKKRVEAVFSGSKASSPIRRSGGN